MMVEKNASGPSIADGTDRLVTLLHNKGADNATAVIEALKKDQVVLLKKLSSSDADVLMNAIANKLGLGDSLQLQAAFASSLGHREKIGNYYMSVNARENYQFVSPHSEGSSFINMQLASFYCYENTTDGGETILLHVNQGAQVWQKLRELVTRGKSQRPLTPPEVKQIKVAFRLNMPADTLKPEDEILSRKMPVPGFELFDVLTKPRKMHSQLLDEDLYAYWDSIDSIDVDSAEEFYRFLIKEGLIKLPANRSDVKTLDTDADRRVRKFGDKYEQLFDRKIIYKMQSGDFVIQNNLSWTHAVNNWTPGSGTRKVAAAFA